MQIVRQRTVRRARPHFTRLSLESEWPIRRPRAWQFETACLAPCQDATRGPRLPLEPWRPAGPGLNSRRHAHLPAPSQSAERRGRAADLLLRFLRGVWGLLAIFAGMAGRAGPAWAGNERHRRAPLGLRDDLTHRLRLDRGHLRAPRLAAAPGLWRVRALFRGAGAAGWRRGEPRLRAAVRALDPVQLVPHAHVDA